MGKMAGWGSVVGGIFSFFFLSHNLWGAGIKAKSAEIGSLTFFDTQPKETARNSAHFPPNGNSQKIQ